MALVLIFAVRVHTQELLPPQNRRYCNQDHHGVCKLRNYYIKIYINYVLYLCTKLLDVVYDRVLIQVVCSYITLPLYALVTQVYNPNC